MHVSLSELRELVMDREAWHAVIHGVANSRTRLSDWTGLNWTESEAFAKTERMGCKTQIESLSSDTKVLWEVFTSWMQVPGLTSLCLWYLKRYLGFPNFGIINEQKEERKDRKNEESSEKSRKKYFVFFFRRIWLGCYGRDSCIRWDVAMKLQALLCLAHSEVCA